jgi:hypothetical protein
MAATSIKTFIMQSNEDWNPGITYLGNSLHAKKIEKGM